MIPDASLDDNRSVTIFKREMIENNVSPATTINLNKLIHSKYNEYDQNGYDINNINTCIKGWNQQSMSNEEQQKKSFKIHDNRNHIDDKRPVGWNDDNTSLAEAKCVDL